MYHLSNEEKKYLGNHESFLRQLALQSAYSMNGMLREQTLRTKIGSYRSGNS